MDHATIERKIYIDATPGVVFEVISSPDHLREWWSDEADLNLAPGGTGELVFGQAGSPDAHVAALTVVDVEPPRRFSFRWVYDQGQVPASGNSLLVTFELEPSGAGTALRLTEHGFRERGWDDARLAAAHQDHSAGWDHHLAHLVTYADGLAPVS